MAFAVAQLRPTAPVIYLRLNYIAHFINYFWSPVKTLQLKSAPLLQIKVIIPLSFNNVYKSSG